MRELIKSLNHWKCAKCGAMAEGESKPETLIKIVSNCDHDWVKIPKVFIGISSTNWICVNQVYWLIADIMKGKERGYDVQFLIGVENPEELNKNHIIQNFLRTDCNYLLMLDNDILVDPDIISRFLAYDKDIVGAPVVVMADQGLRYCAANIEKIDGKNVYSSVDISPPNNKLLKLDYVGAGCMMIKRHVLEALPQPVFRTEYDAEGNYVRHGDNYFCEKIKEDGRFEVWLDGTKILGQISTVNLMNAVVGYPNVPQEEAQDPLWMEARKFGIIQKRDEFMDFINLIKLHTPIRTIVEIGSHSGGTLVMFRRIFPNAKIISVDLKPVAFQDPSITYIKGNSRNEKVRRDVLKALDGLSIDLLFIDGDHTKAYGDFEFYRSFCKKFVAFHDIKEGPEAGIVYLDWRKLSSIFIHREFISKKDLSPGYGIGVILL